MKGSVSSTNMTTITAAQARLQLNKLLHRIAKSRKPIHIKGKRHNAVLISDEYWRSIKETLYLISIPGMSTSIRKGLSTPISKCAETGKYT